MLIIDTQLHEPPLYLDWTGSDTTTRFALMTELQLAYLNAVGVDQAILFPLDEAWGEWAAAERPDKFAFVPMVSANGLPNTISAADPDIDAIIAEKAALPGCVGVRILHSTSGFLHPNADRPIYVDPVESFQKVIEGCIRADIPLFMSTAGALEGPGEIARSHPDLRVIVDHLGLPQRPTFLRDDPPFSSLAKLLQLAALPNVYVKLSGAPTLSEEQYPFADLWPHLTEVIEAFGAERLMWGTDISRVQGLAGFTMNVAGGESYQGRHNYGEALHYLLDDDSLSSQQKEWIFGRTAQTVLRWPTEGVSK